MSAGRPLLIVGASGRAAAASARRVGFEPFVIDLFADADTRRLAATLRCPPERYPAAIAELARQAPPGPFLYTGGLENHPTLIEALSFDRKLLGNGPTALAAVRDPFRLHELLDGRALAHPWLNHPTLTPPPGIRWLRKPIRGAGGYGIRFATPADTERAGDESVDYYLQEYLPGPSYSAVYVSHGERFTHAGITRQLVGTDWLHAKPFQYAGSIGPIPPIDEAGGGIQLHASRLVGQAGLTGVWGFDYILHEGQPHLLEVNPRYTASVEVIEYATGQCVLDMFPNSWKQPSRLVGKAVYYASHRISFPTSGPWNNSLAHCTDVWRRPDYADIPDPGSVIEAGQPVLSILIEGETEVACTVALKSRAEELDQLFKHASTGGSDHDRAE